MFGLVESGFGSATESMSDALDRLCAVDLDGFGADEAGVAIVQLERQVRRAQAAQVELLSAIDRAGSFGADGHFSAKVMVRHHGQLSGAEAAQRDRVMRMLRHLPLLRAASVDGRVGTDQIRRLARVWANTRVRDFMPACEQALLAAATELEFPDFDLFCRDWETTVDEDGADQRSKQRWQRRSIKLVEDYNGLWDLRSRLISIDGAELCEIISHFVETERMADIEWAQEHHGDNWRLNLARTNDQLKYDAFMNLIRRGAGAQPGTKSAEVVTNIVIDQATYEHHLARLAGANPEPLDPTNPAHFSHTANGTWISPVEIAAQSLIGHVRRVVINSAGTVIDLGRKQRLFTGSARNAAMLQTLRCYWHGCWIPATQCQIDHLQPARNKGLTNPGNGGPACGTHNRHKEHGYTTWRDPKGQWHIIDANGRPLPNHNHHWTLAA